MIHALRGGSERDPKDYYGRKIVKAELSEDRFKLTFSDGVSISLFDDGQSCCEARYMRTDDDVQALVGGTLRNIESKETKDVPAEYDSHEVAFVEVATENAHVILANHVEHNGYYGGWGLTITEERG